MIDKVWYYRFPGQAIPYNLAERGVTEEEARRLIRRKWSMRRLPTGFELWLGDVYIPGPHDPQLTDD